MTAAVMVYFSLLPFHLLLFSSSIRFEDLSTLYANDETQQAGVCLESISTLSRSLSCFFLFSSFIGYIHMNEGQSESV